LLKALQAVVSAQIEENAASMQAARVGGCQLMRVDTNRIPRNRQWAPMLPRWCCCCCCCCCCALVQDTTACSALAAEEAAMKGRHSNHVKALREATEKKAAAVAKVRRAACVF